VKTIGDAYMAVAGLSGGMKDHATAVAELALAIQREVSTVVSGCGEPFSVRVGVNTGPVVAGVVGVRRLAYDVWGPTVNIANEMESSGVPGGIQVTEATYLRLKDRYTFEQRGEYYVRGVGDVNTYLLKWRRAGR
jgi:class 3 adenylate cyclase